MLKVGERGNLPLEKIEVSEVALRGPQTGSEEFELLKAAIQQAKVIRQNLTVHPSETAEGMYVLTDGLQRYTCAQQLGWKEVPVLVEPAGQLNALVTQVQNNIHNIQTKPAEYAKQLDRILRNDPSMTLTQLGALVCQTGAWVSARLGLLRLLPKIQELVDDGSVNLTNAKLLAQMSEDDQKNWFMRAKDMPSEEFVPQARKHILEAKKAAREARQGVEETFSPVSRMRTKATLEQEIAKPSARNTLLQKDTTPAQAWQMALEWALQLDKPTVDQARRAWEEQKAARDIRKQEVAAAKEAARAAKSAELETAVLSE